jgi:hypothetical protein
VLLLCVTKSDGDRMLYCHKSVSFRGGRLIAARDSVYVSLHQQNYFFIVITEMLQNSLPWFHGEFF